MKGHKGVRMTHSKKLGTVKDYFPWSKCHHPIWIRCDLCDKHFKCRGGEDYYYIHMYVGASENTETDHACKECIEKR